MYGTSRGLRGGSFIAGNGFLKSDYLSYFAPTVEVNYVGFRVSQVPEPASMALLALGGIGMLVRRRGAGR